MNTKIEQITEVTMPIKNKPTLGHTVCTECGETATVHQQSRGNFLYTRGCDCKYRNSTGAVFQTRLWHDTEWVLGASPQPPSNLQKIEQIGDSSTLEFGSAVQEVSEATSGSDSEQSWLPPALSIIAITVALLLSGGRR